MKENSFMSTVNPQQVELFDKDAPLWWKVGGPFDLLHAMNRLRIEFITDQVPHLQRLKVLDIGCGGGILAEPLTRLGAIVTGIDATQSAIDVAKQHAHEMGLAIDYHCVDVETFAAQHAGTFDLVIASEIIEHVENPQNFLSAALTCLKPEVNFGLIVSTINKTWMSWLGAIVGAEYVLRLVARGTHDWQHFLKPSEIAGLLTHINTAQQLPPYHWQELRGMKLDICKKEWRWTKDLSINYIGVIKKGDS